jgi:hypothetical protein
VTSREYAIYREAARYEETPAQNALIYFSSIKSGRVVSFLPGRRAVSDPLGVLIQLFASHEPLSDVGGL